MCLRAQVIKPFKDLWHECCTEIVPKTTEAHAHHFLLGKLLRAFEGKCPPPRNEVFYAFILLLFGSNQF